MLQTRATEFEDRLAEILALAELPVASPAELTSRLRQIYTALHALDLGQYLACEIRHRVPQLLRRAFAARMRIRDRIPEWQTERMLNRDAVAALRDVFRISRYGTDMLGEIGISNARHGPNEKGRRAFTGRDYNTLVHPKFDDGRNIPFQSGDVLLVRDSAPNSATIARIGAIDTQFSHIGIIYIDPENRHWMVEARIETGAVITSLEQVLDRGLGRAVLYRHKDAELAARAARMIYARVRKSGSGFAPLIPYDFSMRLRGRKKLFCGKLVRQAFLDASNGKVKLPAFKTRIPRKANRRFFKSIGVTTRETFTPGDIDIDPDFDLVAEWQDYRLTPNLRRQDLIMTKLFEWMETRGYRFKVDLFVLFIAVFGRMSRYLSDRSRQLIANVVPKVPRNMSSSCVAMLAMLHKTTEALMPPLTALDDDHVKMTGAPLHPIHILNHLEKLRELSGGGIGYLRAKG